MRPEVWIRRSIVVAICLFASSAIGLSTLAQQPGNRTAADSPAPLQLKQSSRESYAQGNPGKAREQLAGLLDVYRAEHAINPSWRGRYQWSRRLAEVAHEYLRDGELDDALAVLGEAADLDVPLRKGFDNGLASAAGGLHRRLAAIDSDRRYELLHDWSMPTESRPSVRVLESLVPIVAPPSAFARAFGERPRASSVAVAHLGEVTGLFSTAWCTDGADDRTQLPPSNRSVEPDIRRGPDRLPLKAVAWNRLRLTLSGNTVELQLNGELVYRRDLEASNMRQFGLFHCSDRTATRVRNVVWKGDWPRKLPSLAEQELADVSLVAKLDAKLPDMQALEHDFAKGGLEPKLFRILPGGDATIAAHRDGVHVTQPGTDPNVWHENRISVRLALTGDFDVTASFDQLVTTRPAAGRYAGVAIVACLQCEPYINLWLHRRRAGYGEQFIETTSQHPTPDGEARWDVWKNLPNESTRGTLRLARRGKTIYYLYADGDSTQYRLHRQQELSDAPLKMDGLMLFTQMGGIGNTSVVWKSVSVRADKINYDPTRNAVPKIPEEKTLLRSFLDLFR